MMNTPQPNFQNPQMEYGRKKGSRFTSIITVITILFVLFIVFKKFNTINEFLTGPGLTGEMTGLLQIGQQISIEGILLPNADLANYTYTHQLQTTSSGIFGLKSRTIDLNQYTGDITIEGNVEKENSGMYIIEVISVIGNMSLETGETLQTEPNGAYLEKAGIYFPQNFFNTYVLENSGENKEVKIKNLATNTAIKINYFVCKKGDPNDDCTQLKKNFSSMIERQITTANNDNLIKLSDVNTRFITNELFGYFINDLPAQEVTDLSQYLVLPNQTYVQENLLDKVSTLCVDGLTKLEKADQNSLSLDTSNKIVLKVTGIVNSGAAECKIAVNPSLPTLGTKLSFTYPDTASQTTTLSTTTTTSSEIQQNLLKSTNVNQFPINLEKALTYTSTKRGFQIIFPSSNIAYDSLNIASTLDIDGVNCSVQTNVIMYKDKTNLDINPSLKIYECRVKSSAVIPNTYLTRTLDDGRTYIIEAIDPSRIDFANNIVIEAL